MAYMFKIAEAEDSEIIKELINKMYGTTYETRENEEISKAIKDKNEIYMLAYDGDCCMGFSGASLNNDYYADVITPDIAVIDYIYTLEDKRNIVVSFELIVRLVNKLLENGTKKAIMQVQTYNKQRFFHYALSDKNIIKTTPIEKDGEIYEDQILLINDLNKIANTTLKTLMLKARTFLKTEAESIKSIQQLKEKEEN